jgi:hypothetical protein
MFWIVCGVIVLIELGFMMFWTVTDPEGNAPEAVKAQLDTEFQRLDDLYKRANAGDPLGVFDPENPEDIKRLTDVYLLTEKWKGVLSPHVAKYNQQLDAIKQDLAARSAVLHQAIVDNEDLSTWYSAYEGKSKEILLSLKNANGLVLPDDAKPESLDLEADEKIRSIAGFYTKGVNLPQVSDHPLLTTRARIIEKLAEVLVSTKAKVLPSPVAPPKEGQPLDGLGASIQSVEWRQSSGTGPDENPYVTPYQLTLTLQGPASSLLAVEAALERISSPVVVVTGGSLVQRGNWKPGERKGRAVEPLAATINLTVLDYSKIASEPSPVPAAEPENAQGKHK